MGYAIADLMLPGLPPAPVVFGEETIRNMDGVQVLALRIMWREEANGHVMIRKARFYLENGKWIYAGEA